MKQDFRTPLARVRGLGAARSGTDHFWWQRITAVANVPLTIIFILIVVSLLGSNQAAAQRVLGTPLVAIAVLLFIGSITHHMRLGMQIIIEDYVHGDILRPLCIMANLFFTVTISIAAAFALLKLSFGV